MFNIDISLFFSFIYFLFILFRAVFTLENKIEINSSVSSNNGVNFDDPNSIIDKSIF